MSVKTLSVTAGLMVAILLGIIGSPGKPAAARSFAATGCHKP